MSTIRSRLGELLIQHQIITATQLDQALTKQRAEGGNLNRLLVEMGLVNEEKLLNFLSKQWQIPFIDLKNYALNNELVLQLPESAARRLQTILLEETPKGLLVGMVDPQDIVSVDQLSNLLKRPIQLALIREEDWIGAINRTYLHSEDLSNYAKKMSEDIIEKEFDIAELGNLQEASDAPITKFLQSLFIEAVKMRASDIHLEPDEKFLRIRQRVDGVLIETKVPEKTIAPALALRLKLMCGLKIAEKRLPQDGRFSIKVHNRNIDIRLSTMPIQYGESIVMRLLDRTGLQLNLMKLGIESSVLKTLYRLLQIPNGMILITGPTGSGKTSTLYSMLNELNKPERKIITVEDPVEYRLPRINQVQVHPEIGLTFANVLRAVLRQNPDVLMVGEIRDKETAYIALNAAMTGHLVLATMHTNDAISSATRLLEMGGDGYRVAGGLRAVMAQRLIRKNCLSCLQAYSPDSQEKMWLQKFAHQQSFEAILKKGQGCAQCFNTGFQGRMPIFELFEVKDAITEALASGSIPAFMKAVREKVYISLTENAVSLALKGLTTLQEAIRVTIGLDLMPDELKSEGATLNVENVPV